LCEALDLWLLKQAGGRFKNGRKYYGSLFTVTANKRIIASLKSEL